MQDSEQGGTDLMNFEVRHPDLMRHDVCFHKISIHLCFFFFYFVYCNFSDKPVGA